MGGVTTGSLLLCNTTTLVTAGSTIVGQGNKPILWALLSYDDVATPTPAWVDVTPDVRSFSTSRGRESELAEMDAGTATVVLDNRTNTYDPSTHAYIRPMNTLWLREQFSGLTNDIIKGYVESYDQQWPSGGKVDAICVANVADGFKPLALDALPVTDPPRDTYADLVMFEEPQAYWQMHDAVIDKQAAATAGNELEGPLSGLASSTPSPIVGDPLGYLTLTGTGGYLQGTFDLGQSGDPSGCNEYTIEAWVKYGSASGSIVLVAPGASVAAAELLFFVGGVIRCRMTNSVSTAFSVDAPVLQTGTWYHVVGTIEGGSVRLYINGVQVGSTAFTAPLKSGTPPGNIYVGNESGAGSYDCSFSHVALYRHGLNATTIAAHYTAGTARGFAQAFSGDRIRAVLDSVANNAPRFIHTGDRGVTPTFMHGQDPLSEIRSARSAEAVDSVCFIAADGTFTFLAASHRGISPWSVTQSTFGDEGHANEWPYADLDVDYSDAFLANYLTVTREGGLVQTRSDATSIAKYLKRPQSLTGLPLLADSDADNIAVAMLAKYKDPMLRAQSISFTTADVNTCHEIFQRELCDRIRIIRTLPGGGWLDQTLYIQKIEVSASPGNPWFVTFGVSPL